jgi:hypothetical protein
LNRLILGGPLDPTERFPYWPRRLARGGPAEEPFTAEQEQARLAGHP